MPFWCSIRSTHQCILYIIVFLQHTHTRDDKKCYHNGLHRNEICRMLKWIPANVYAWKSFCNIKRICQRARAIESITSTVTKHDEPMIEHTHTHAHIVSSNLCVFFLYPIIKLSRVVYIFRMCVICTRFVVFVLATQMVERGALFFSFEFHSRESFVTFIWFIFTSRNYEFIILLNIRREQKLDA